MPRTTKRKLALSSINMVASGRERTVSANRCPRDWPLQNAVTEGRASTRALMRAWMRAANGAVVFDDRETRIILSCRGSVLLRAISQSFGGNRKCPPFGA